jgi:hypothetical protein
VGMLRRMKDMKDMANAAPAMVAQAQQLGAQARQMAAAQQAAMQAQLMQAGGMQAGGMQAGGMQAGAVAAGPDFEPIAGVSLDQFVAVSKGVAVYNYDQSRLAEIAALQGIPAYSWEDASRGWNDRIKGNPAVAQRFNQLYRAG